jgi:phenylpropionate dioxygenase-like ring-hydroxylating dioxygenase large terminal subunit
MPGGAAVHDLSRAAAREFSTDRYTSQSFQESEIESVFLKSWLVVARESELPEAGDCLPVDELGQSILLVRGKDRVVRAFRNACRHRGTRLVNGACNVPTIRCPYHSWSYLLDGTLAGVPGLDGFADLERASNGLTAVRSTVWGGFVWVTFSAAAPPLREYLGALGDRLEPYRLEEMRPLLKRTWTLQCNWKAVLDQATERYHVESVHGKSIGPHIPEEATFIGLDPHHAQTVPIADYWWRTRLDRLSVSSQPAFTAEQLRLFLKCVVFPNTLFNVLPYHLTVFRVVPLTPDTCRFHYEFHIRAGASAVARARGYLTLLASLHILREDFGLLEPFQKGVRAAGSQAIHFHREEHPLAYFHGVIDRLIARARTCPNPE